MHGKFKVLSIANGETNTIDCNGKEDALQYMNETLVKLADVGEIKYIEKGNKNMSRGMRDMSRTPLTEKEIEYVKGEIRKIGADENVFVFNDPRHITRSTSYNFVDDRVYISRNVFPDTKYSSSHPRDIMSVAAVLAHEYYGHRAFREEYVTDYNISPDFHTTPIWEDECRASIIAAKTTPNLTERDRCNLVMDAVFRAEEYNQYLEMDAFMKEVVYGYPVSEDEKNIAQSNTRIKFISKKSTRRDRTDGDNGDPLPDMQYYPGDLRDL